MGKSKVKVHGIGKNFGQDKRASKNILSTVEGELPVMGGMFKDHKSGLKYRPYVNGNIGPIAKCSNIMSVLLVNYVENIKENLGFRHSKSTEELIAKFVDYNMKVDENPNVTTSNKLIASMDIKALFPSLRTQDCANLVRDAVNKSEIVIKDIDMKEICIFLRKHLTNEQILKCNICEFIPTMKKKSKDHMKGDN